MQQSDVHVSRTTRRPFTYTICPTLLLLHPSLPHPPTPRRHGPVANTRVRGVQTCTLKQSNGSRIYRNKVSNSPLFLFCPLRRRENHKTHLAFVGGGGVGEEDGGRVSESLEVGGMR